MKVYK